MSYGYFNEVVVFDTTYKTNGYSLPFAPFVGENDHRQSIRPGGALIANETEESFTWLFTAWLQAMHGQKPGFIITGTFKGVSSIYHRLCMWHIMKKFPEKLASCETYDMFHTKFN